MLKPTMAAFAYTALLCRFFCCICFLCLSLSLLAQKNFKPGYIVKSSGDTLRGEIDFRDWLTNPSRIFFRKALEKEAQFYGPADIGGFFVDNERYESANVQVEKSSNDLESLTSSAKFKLAPQHVFLRTLISGEKSLLYLRDDKGREHFYIKRADSCEALLYKRYLQDRPSEAGTGDVKQVSVNSAYVRTLLNYLEACPDLSVKISGALYTVKSLMSLFNEYYSCRQTSWTYKMKRDKAYVEAGPLAGVSFSKISFSKNSLSNIHLSGPDFPYVASFTGGFFLDIIVARNRGKWSINNEVIYSSYTAKGTYESRTDEHNYSRAYTEIGADYIKLNNMARYRFNVGGVSFFADAGISNGLSIKEHNYTKRESETYSVYKSSEGPAIETFRKYEQGYLIGLGSKISRLSIELRMEKGNGMSSYSRFKSAATRFHVLLGYRIY